MQTKVLKFFMIMSLVGSLFLVSCAKKNNSSSNRAGTAARGNLTGADVTALGINKCSDGSTGWGRLLDDGTLSGSLFRQSYLKFLGAEDSGQLGDLDGTGTSRENGADIKLNLKIANNQLNLTDSRLQLAIRDSYVGQQGADGKLIEEISVVYQGATSGQLTNIVNGSGNFTLVFKDDYGTVQVEGTFNGTETKGTRVSFNNTNGVNGSLGTFSTRTCGVFF